MGDINYFLSLIARTPTGGSAWSIDQLGSESWEADVLPLNDTRKIELVFDLTSIDK
jgi:hypothetical protein